MTEEALHAMGLDPQAARAGRQGNWMRDLSQALTPGILVKIGGADRIFAILNVLSIKEFGRGFTAGEFGTYDPVEHIDNPTDLRASDVNRQVAPGIDGAAGAGRPDEPRRLPDDRRRPRQPGRHREPGLRRRRPALRRDRRART